MLPVSPSSWDVANAWYGIRKYLQSIFTILTTNIEFGTYDFTTGKFFPNNICGQLINFTFTVANTEYAIPHTLNKLPTGYIVVGTDKGGKIYQLYNTGTVWTKTNIYLKCDTNTVNSLLFVF